jgi:hypothetical protein
MNPKIIPLFLVFSFLFLLLCSWFVYIYIDQPCSNTMMLQYKRMIKHCEAPHSISPISHSSHHSHHRHHYHDPSWICLLEKRIGDLHDGRWLCDPQQILPHGILYSYGTRNRSIEEIFAKNYQCDVHVFDFSTLPSSSSVVSSLHHSKAHFSSQQFLESLQQNQYHGRNVDLLSFEIENFLVCSKASQISHILAAFLYENLLEQLDQLRISVDQLIFSFHYSSKDISGSTSSIDTLCQTFMEKDDSLSASSFSSTSHQINLLYHHLTRRGYALYHREIIPRSSPSSSSSSHLHDHHHHFVERIDYSFVKLNIDCDSLSVPHSSKYFTI